MRNISYLVVLFGIILGLGMLTDASAQTGFSFICPKKAPGIKTMRRAMKQQVESLVDTSAFGNAKARVKMRKVALDAPTSVLSLDELFSGLTFVNSDHPTGLAYAAEGSIDFGSAGTCAYTYRVTITYTAVEAVTGKKVSARTSTDIDVTLPSTKIKAAN